VSAFDTFYRENAPRLCAFLRRIVGNAQVAEDIVQETFAQVWQRPNGFEPTRGTLRAYLYGIGRKRAAEWWRTRKPQTAHIEDQEDKRIALPNHTETNSIVADAFARLPEEQQSLLWLREIEGYSYEELAQILEIPIGTVRSRLFAAREQLRAIWNGTQQVQKEHA
jgi:RNA polymerase sigma-70 factor (ECF subfamily)